MVLVVHRCQLFKCAELLTPLDSVHLTLAGDAEEIYEDMAARTRLKLVLVKVGRLVAVFMLQDTSSLSSFVMEGAVEDGLKEISQPAA
jgi:hypothetical protein